MHNLVNKNVAEFSWQYLEPIKTKLLFIPIFGRLEKNVISVVKKK
jgi:hypothetical protein